MKSEYIVVNLNTTQFTNLLFNFINKSKQDSSINVIFRIIDKAKQVINLFEESSNNYYCMRLLSDSFDYLTGSKSKDHWSLSSRDPHSYARYDSISLLDSLFNSFYFLKLGNNLKDLIQNFVKSSKTSGNYDNNFCPIYTGIILIVYEAILDTTLDLYSQLTYKYSRPSDDYLEELMYFLELKLEPVVVLRPTVIDVPNTSPNQIKLELTR